MTYDLTFAHNLCQKKNLVFSERMAATADEIFTSVNATQEQFDAAVDLWCDNVATTWNPENYSLWQRIIVAIYFLGGFKKQRPTNG